jgi:hypothetical protein
MRQRTVVRAHDTSTLPFVAAKARRECQRCGERGARVCAARVLEPPEGTRAPWFLAVLCSTCIAVIRADPSCVVVAGAA